MFPELPDARMDTRKPIVILPENCRVEAQPLHNQIF